MQLEKGQPMKRYSSRQLVASPRLLYAIRRRMPLKLTAFEWRPMDWEIGYGYRGPIVPRVQITEAQAESLMRNDVVHAEAGVRACVAAPLSEAEYDAMVSFAFDCDPPHFIVSAPVMALNEGRYSDLRETLNIESLASRFGPVIGRQARLWEMDRISL